MGYSCVPRPLSQKINSYIKPSLRITALDVDIRPEKVATVTALAEWLRLHEVYTTSV
jgi:hypothetical protein